ncbi:DMT family transporter [Neptunicella sp. SCSIO 80796]|uniref:DMT family transporter n=1 Tax=Neptunicella plasticusilytica TaxID=3117012 RepID=UPI003A4D3B85
MIAILWAWLMACSFVVSGMMTHYASPLAATGLRFLLALALMTPFYMANRSHHSMPLKTLCQSPVTLLHYALISGSLVGFFVGLFTALKTTTSLNTSVMYTLVPLLAAMLAMIFGVRTSTKQWLGYILGAGGAVTVLLVTRGGKLEWHIGDMIYLGACGLLAFHVISVQLWGGGVSAIEGAYRILLFGVLWLVPIVVIWGELSQVQWQAQRFWLLLLFLTVFATLLTFVLQQLVIKFAGAKRLLGMSYTIPIWVSCYQATQQLDLALFSAGFTIGSIMVILALLMIDSTSNREKVAVNG